MTKHARGLGLTEEDLKSFPSPEEMLEEMNQTDSGIPLIMRADHSVHTSRLSLATRVRDHSATRGEFLAQGPDPEVLRVGALATDLYLAAAGSIAELLGWASAAQMKEIRGEIGSVLVQVLRAGCPG